MFAEFRGGGAGSPTSPPPSKYAPDQTPGVYAGPSVYLKFYGISTSRSSTAERNRKGKHDTDTDGKRPWSVVQSLRLCLPRRAVECCTTQFSQGLPTPAVTLCMWLSNLCLRFHPSKNSHVRPTCQRNKIWMLSNNSSITFKLTCVTYSSPQAWIYSDPPQGGGL